jgi:hypothetical protein
LYHIFLHQIEWPKDRPVFAFQPIGDNLAFALRRHADELGTSLNQADKALLAGALGLTTEKAAPAQGS